MLLFSLEVDLQLGNNRPRCIHDDTSDSLDCYRLSWCLLGARSDDLCRRSRTRQYKRKKSDGNREIVHPFHSSIIFTKSLNK